MEPPPCDQIQLMSLYFCEVPLRIKLAMLRVGLYEQGKRISIVAAELRDEIEASRDGGADDAA